jgi:hypothetical protein
VFDEQGMLFPPPPLRITCYVFYTISHFCVWIVCNIHQQGRLKVITGLCCSCSSVNYFSPVFYPPIHLNLLCLPILKPSIKKKRLATMVNTNAASSLNIYFSPFTIFLAAIATARHSPVKSLSR